MKMRDLDTYKVKKNLIKAENLLRKRFRERISNLSHYCRKHAFFMFLKPYLRMQKHACKCMCWPTYVGYYPCTWAKGQFGHFISKNRFLLI